MTADDVLTLAKTIDPDACWADDDLPRVCLLVSPRAAEVVLAAVPGAYDDPNDPPTAHTRVGFLTPLESLV